jgi:uncharacterized protein (DUF2267 family)
MTTGISTFDQSLNTTIEWLKDVQEEMGLDDEQRAFRVLRGVLHALRDRLTVEEAVRAVFTVLERRMPDGEIEDIKRILPQPIRDLWP